MSTKNAEPKAVATMMIETEVNVAVAATAVVAEESSELRAASPLLSLSVDSPQPSDAWPSDHFILLITMSLSKEEQVNSNSAK
jgi:hypothetical protein